MIERMSEIQLKYVELGFLVFSTVLRTIFFNNQSQYLWNAQKAINLDYAFILFLFVFALLLTVPFVSCFWSLK